MSYTPCPTCCPDGTPQCHCHEFSADNELNEPYEGQVIDPRVDILMDQVNHLIAMLGWLQTEYTAQQEILEDMIKRFVLASEQDD